MASIINDVSTLNPVSVAFEIRPKAISEIQDAIRSHLGAISIGGGRFSMGGQIAEENSLHIDMRDYSQILSFSPENKTITVQAGIRWREIQKAIDAHNLSIMIMQTYSNFTVGGSLSVNAHGRYVGLGPVIFSVLSLSLVLANGELVKASPEENSQLFYGVIGGYGGLGVICEVTLKLVSNTKIERINHKMDTSKYLQYFIDHVRHNKQAVFHNADMYPPHYTRLRAITWVETDKSLTLPNRVMEPKTSYAVERYFVWAIMSTPFGKWRREYLIDPAIYWFQRVMWRNTEASRYDVQELEPRSRKKSTFILQEYFIPVKRFDEFVPKMAEILQRYQVNMLNISVRHAIQDPGSMLAWAKDEVFAFVLYYKQGVSLIDQTRVGLWTRELIEAAISVGGSYYLPYQLHARIDQFHRAYPRAKDYFTLKHRIDPENKFSNRFLDKYKNDLTEVKKMNRESSEFRQVYLNDYWRDQFYLFLQNVYRIYPEDKFHDLIFKTTQLYNADKEIYQALQKNLPDIKPHLTSIRYAVPALIKQKKEMVRQTLALLNGRKVFNGYVEIGSTGRYVSELRKHVTINGSIYLINEVAPTYSPEDIAERGQIRKLGEYLPLNNYANIDLPQESVDLVTCYIGLHHAPLDRLQEFVQSIYRILRRGGILILRDHDANTDEMKTFVSLVHTVFNAGLGVTWENNLKEFRAFTSTADQQNLLANCHFKYSGHSLLQDHDPSLNTLMAFTKE